MKNKKKIILFGIIILVLSIVAAVIIAVCANKSKRNENYKITSTLKFDYYQDSSLTQRVSFIYSDKKLKDVTLTLYFDSKETAKNSYKIYKEANEYKDYKVVKNTLVLYYFSEDILEYKTLSQEEITQIYTNDGYVISK